MQNMNTVPEAANADSITRIVWQAAMPKGCSKTVLACLAWHAVLNERDQCWPYIDTIARLCGLQRRTAIANLSALVKAGLITSTPRPGTSNLYQLNRAALAALSSEQTNAETSNRGEENAQRSAENANRGEKNARRGVVFLTHKGEGKEMNEEGRERQSACAPATDHKAAFPPPQYLENLKTKDKAPAIIADPMPMLPAAAESVLAIAPDTLSALNTRRKAAGKSALGRDDVAHLAAEANRAGLTLTQVAAVIESRGWLWYDADWHGARDVPQSDADRAQARAKANQVQANLLRRSIEAMRPTTGVATHNPVARPGTATAPLRTVMLHHSAPVSVGATNGTNTGWACTAVARFVDGQTISHATISSAASALGLPLATLKAKRAAHLAAVAA